MRVILSKKGFDSGFGGFASPLLDDAYVVSLPIPALYREDKRIYYADIDYSRFGKITDLLKEMGRTKVKTTKGARSKWCCAKELPAHLDPDINKEAYPRRRGWRGLFGINGKSQTHIENQTRGMGLKSGDLFLFYGWFEKYDIHKDRLVNAEHMEDYCSGRHILFGYLQIESVLPLYEMNREDQRIEEWMDYHPHVGENRRMVGDKIGFPKNTLYVARPFFEKTNKPGFGLFYYDRDSAPHLTLTKKGCSRTQWKLTQAFASPKNAFISRNPNGWKTWNDGKGYFQSSKGYGQEFVVEERPSIEEWARSLICRFANV